MTLTVGNEPQYSGGVNSSYSASRTRRVTLVELTELVSCILLTCTSIVYADIRKYLPLPMVVKVIADDMIGCGLFLYCTL
jgi:hypothetical protein